jgi:AsmA protein
MVRNVQAAFGLTEKGKEKPRTDFSEFHVPFTLTNGVFDTRNTKLLSPLLRVFAFGKADLVRETIDMRVEPKFVATIKGQGDTMDRTGVTVPVLVSGTFQEPKFKPDLKGMLQKTFKEGVPEADELKKLIPATPSKEKGSKKTLEDTFKGVLKSLPLGE